MSTYRLSSIAASGLLSLALLAQVPQAISYQAVLRDPVAGTPLAGATATGRYLLHAGVSTGTVVYEETHAISANDQGLFTLRIGGGTPVSGSFSSIDWGSGPYFLEVQLDVANAGVFTAMGTQELLSVPYALHAGKSSNVPDGTEVGQLMHWDGNTWVADSGLYVYQKRFGIGVQQPEAPLSVKSREHLYQKFQDGDIPTGQDFSISSAGGTGFSIDDASTGVGTSRFFIDAATGNVGVGTTTPTEKYFIHAVHHGGRTGMGLRNGAIAAQAGWVIAHLDDPAPERTGAFALLEKDDVADRERITVLPGGNVGINEQLPYATLHVTRPVADPGQPISLSENTGIVMVGPLEQHLVMDSQSMQARHLLAGATSVVGTPGTLRLQPLGGDLIVHGDDAETAHHVTVTSDGRIGVGKAPAEKLDVNGAMVLGNSSSTTPVPGTIRFNGTDFEGRTAGGDWAIFNGTIWQRGYASNSVHHNGRVGIGVDEPAASLHVEQHGAEEAPAPGVFVSLIDSYTNLIDDRNLIGLRVQTAGSASAAGFSKNVGLYVADVSGQAAHENNIAAVLNGNVVIGDLRTQAKEVGADGTNVLAIQDGAAPATSTSGDPTVTNGGVQLFSASDADGVSTLHLMNGDGSVVQLRPQNPLSAADLSPVNPVYDPATAALIENMRTRINELESRLISLGLLKP